MFQLSKQAEARAARARVCVLGRAAWEADGDAGCVAARATCAALGPAHRTSASALLCWSGADDITLALY